MITVRMRALFMLMVLARVAAAEPTSDDERADVPSPSAQGIPLVAQTATWRYQVVTAPRIAAQIGALAASGLDAVAGRGSAVEVLGAAVPVPAKWPLDIDGDEHTTGPIAPKLRADQRVAALFAVTRFALGDEHQGMRMLELRLRYEDGCAIWLNGTEVARRALPAGSTVALATHPHGPEWETFFVPVAPGLLHRGDNTLAIEVHPSGRRQAPELAVDVIGRRDLGIVRGPILAAVGATTATIVVDTDPGLDAEIDWGSAEPFDHHAASPAGTRHVFKLDQLPQHAQVRYRVRAGGVPAKTYAFHTLPAAGDPIRIGVYGDVRGGHTTHRRIVEQMLAEPLDLVAVTGDMVLHGSDDADWQQFFTITGELLAQVAYLPSVGNHDVGWDAADVARRAEDLFSLPPGPPDRPDGTYWYSFDLADIHLVFLDSNAYERPEQETWLDADLAAARARKVRAILAFTHDGPFSRGYHRGSKIAAERYVPILAKYRVDLLLSGHDHLYQRGEHDGVRYIVSGGGGASLYNVTCGAKGKPKCADDGMQKVAIEHHYIVVTIDRTTLEMCPRRADASLLEKCVQYPLH